MENNDNILFAEYLDGSLSNPELELIEKRLNEEPAFSDAFEDFKDIHKVLENRFSPQREAVLESIQKADSNLKSQLNVPTDRKKVFPFRPWQMGVAASILLVIGLFMFNSLGKPSYSNYADPGEITLTVRSEANSISKNAEVAFNTGNYIQAISYFDTILEKSPGNSEIQFYKGIALIETDQFEKADDVLKLLSEGNSAYSYKAIYWSGLSQLKQKNYEEAKKILGAIPSNTPEYSRAKEVLSKL